MPHPGLAIRFRSILVGLRADRFGPVLNSVDPEAEDTSREAHSRRGHTVRVGLFGKRRQPDWQDVTTWSARQYSKRAESIDAQRLFLAAEEDGWPSVRVMSQFLQSQWPIVCKETDDHFRARGAIRQTLIEDVSAMELAIRAAGPVMFPLSHGEVADALVAELRSREADTDT